MRYVTPPEVRVRADVTDPRRTIGRRSHRERQRVALAHGDVDEVQVPLLAKVRQLAGRIERSTDDRDRIREQLHAPLTDRRRPCGLRLWRPGLRSGEESAADVVGNIAVQRLTGPIEPALADGRRGDEIHLQALLHAGAPVLEIDRPRVVEDFLPFLRSVRIAGAVSTAVDVGEFSVADDLEGLQRHHAVAAAECVGGTYHLLPFYTCCPADESTANTVQIATVSERTASRLCMTSLQVSAVRQA